MAESRNQLVVGLLRRRVGDERQGRAGRAVAAAAAAGHADRERGESEGERGEGAEHGVLSWGRDRLRLVHSRLTLWSFRRARVGNPERVDGGARITPYRDGPYIVRGDFVVTDQQGRPLETRRRTIALCRCGRS